MEQWPIGTHYIEHAEVDDQDPDVVIWCLLCGQFPLRYGNGILADVINGMVGHWVEVSQDKLGKYDMRVIPTPSQKSENGGE